MKLNARSRKFWSHKIFHFHYTISVEASSFSGAYVARPKTIGIARAGGVPVRDS